MPNSKLRVSSSANREISKSPSTRVALRTPRAPQSAYRRQLSNGQELAQKVVLGIGGE